MRHLRELRVRRAAVDLQALKDADIGGVERHRANRPFASERQQVANERIQAIAFFEDQVHQRGVRAFVRHVAPQHFDAAA